MIENPAAWLADLRQEIDTTCSSLKSICDRLQNAWGVGGVGSTNTGYTNPVDPRLVDPGLVDPNQVDPTHPPIVPLPKRECAGGVREVFEHWRLAMGKGRAILDRKRRRLIEARLGEGRTVAELCRAIDGCKADPFSMGKNDRATKFNDLSLICRDAEHVERFLAIADAAKKTPLRRPAEPAKVLLVSDEPIRMSKDEAKQKLAALMAGLGTRGIP